MGIDQLSTGKLSAAILHPRRLLKFLHKVVWDVTQKHSYFAPLYTELYHHYETDQVSFTNTEDMLIIQIPIFFVNKNQQPLNLFQLHNVPVPLDRDTYDCKENKYTEISLSHEYIAISGKEYMDISEKALSSCFTLHMDYLCESLHLTTGIKQLSCAAAIYMDISMEQDHPNELDIKIHELCSFTYYEYLQPPPKDITNRMKSSLQTCLQIGN